MNQGQEKFYNYILERVEDSKMDDAKALLSESFDRQDKGTFEREYMEDFIPRMVALLKQDSVEEVTGVMALFGEMNRKNKR